MLRPFAGEVLFVLNMRKSLIHGEMKVLEGGVYETQAVGSGAIGVAHVGFVRGRRSPEYCAYVWYIAAASVDR
jgi:diaminopimelate epimerase